MKSIVYDMSGITVTVELSRTLVFRMKLALLLMRLAARVGGFSFVVDEID
jgi:hypothetical protein